jgi:hypothetical protein
MTYIKIFVELKIQDFHQNYKVIVQQLEMFHQRDIVFRIIPTYKPIFNMNKIC